MMRKLILFSFVGAAAIAVMIFFAPGILTVKTAQPKNSCLFTADREDRCRFDGAPLEMAGSPVFVEKFQHAFLPTSKELTFIDARGVMWTAPVQTLTDGASIPTIFEPIMGDRQSREYLLAAAMHDAFCGVGNEALPTFQTRSWEDVHRMFFEALIVAGTSPQKAKIMFAAVYLGGPRWDDPERGLDSVAPDDLIQELEWCADWIAANDPSPAEIETWMKTREAALIAGESVPPIL
ncbi:DUF1353 domain-containing protein [Marivita sp.]|uniref:DUF1353 domain-containing protein n=1 Tax=Marivita sp. TaxID=2003365 RepID=UPI003F6C4DA5